ncbi:hypothetical protein [Oceanicoccus sp. KOV_DT_Chl]|uniref:hypothetical protein n=1 Tax=Oceanicoccus sp. KOV_DT_Chl TaxID=1904639 RepID=UPI000C7E71A2|nr:hypothetical protein [Oceanicoccus sp. KOV_DT_Chl]
MNYTVFDYDIEFTQIQISIGYIFSINDSYKMAFAVGYVDLDLEQDTQLSSYWADNIGNVLPEDNNNFNFGKDNYGANEVMLSFISSFKLTNKINLDVRLDYVDINESSTSLTGELNYKFSPLFSVFADLFSTGDEDQYGLGVRYYF